VFSKRFDRRVKILATVFVLSLAGGIAFGVSALWPGHRDIGYEPDQPIAYSHRLHAGELKIDCRYCHSTVDRSAFAAVPSVSVCMNCHTQVKSRDSKGNVTREMQKLLDAWESQQPLEWVKVHDLADFVFFDHRRHMAAGLECQECHGPVETMERVRRVHALTMGWCLECHRRPPEEDNDPVKTQRAPDHCTTCHR
jgi:hypothetical protein